jgi:hypothetical protein
MNTNKTENNTNNSSNNNAADKVLAKFRPICEAAQTVIDGMKEKERKQIKDIADAVALSLQMEAKRVLNTVNDFLHTTECGYVSRGKHGGFIKGQKPVRIIKSKTTESLIDLNDEDLNS